MNGWLILGGLLTLLASEFWRGVRINGYVRLFVWFVLLIAGGVMFSIGIKPTA